MSEFVHSATPTADEPTELHYVVVDQSYDAEQAAKDRARERLTEELNTGGRFKRIVKSVWKGGAFKEYYELKYRREARAEIDENENVLHFQATAEASERARLATIDRFLSDDDEMIHAEAGESREQLSDQDELNQEVKELIRRNIEGELSDEALVEERSRLLDAYQDSHDGEMTGRARVRVDNILEVAAAVRGAIDHGESLDSVLANMKISMAESRSGVRTEARYNKVERAAEKLAQSKVGSLVGPETVITAATLAASLARYGSHSVVGAVTKSIAPGIAGGLWAGLRENKRMKDDRTQHAREMAQGQSMEENSKRREEIEETRYNTASAQELTDELARHFDSEQDFADREALDAALTALAAVETRIKLSDSRNIDLITYSGAGSIEEERLALDIARAQAKTIARARLEDGSFRQNMGVDDEFNLEDALRERSDLFMLAVENDMTDKDRAFNKLKRRHVAAAAAKGALFGVTLGALAQEGIASLSDTRQGLIEQLWGAHNQPLDGEMHQTVLDSLVQGTHHNVVDTVTHHGPDLNYDNHSLGAHGSIALSHDMSLEKAADGLMEIKDHNGNILADHLETNGKGELTPDAIARLHHAGITVENTSHTVNLPPTAETRMGGLHDYMAAHHADTTRVSRDFWYDNDTPRFDKNELELQWGDHGDGIATDHSFQFNIANMQPDGSSHDGHALAWQQAAESGHLKLAVSASAGTQTEAFMVNIKPDGSIDIPKGSPAAAFFSEHDGHAVFNGKYAEVVQVADKDSSGVTHIRPLATLVGTDEARNGNFSIQRTVPHTEYRPSYKLTSSGYDTVQHHEQATFTEMAPTIPVVPRRSLESLRKHRLDVSDYYRYGYGGNEYETRRHYEQLERERSPRLNQDPLARLNTRQELDWYRDEVRKNAGDAYADEIDRAIDESPELRNLSPDTEAIVTIPVAAASESENIYRTLSVYAQQGDVTKKVPILLHVNWFDSAEGDSEKAAKIAKTWDEIERARRDFPGLQIATMKTVWNAERQQRGEYGNGMIGHVAQRLYDTAMLAVQRAMAEGRMPDKEVLMIRNDSDAQGMDREYLERMLRAFARFPGKDIFTGAVRWETARHRDLPGFAFVTNFREIMHVVSNRKTVNSWTPTIGINMAARMSTFAAVGGVGHSSHDTGAGTDDLAVGGRIEAARWPTGQGGAKRYSGYSSAYTDSSEQSSGYSQYVPGTNIDTKADRLEACYIDDRPITDAWNSFDKGGYKERGEGLRGRVKESLRRDSSRVLERVETNISAMLTSWFHDPGHATIGLSYLMPSSIDGQETYIITRKNGRATFAFTKKGRAWAKKNIARDPRQVRRRLYEQVNQFSGQRAAQPRFVQ